MPKQSLPPRSLAGKSNDLLVPGKLQSVSKIESSNSNKITQQCPNKENYDSQASCNKDALDAAGQIGIVSGQLELAQLESASVARALKRGKPSACAFVASLPALLTDNELCRLVLQQFQRYGEVSSVKVLRDPENRPYAFVQYNNDEDCQKAIVEGSNSQLGGRRLRCEAAKVNRTLFFSFSVEMSRESVRDLVSSFGGTDLILPGSESGRLVQTDLVTLSSRNWFVKFSYRDEAIQAFASFSEKLEFQVEWAQNVDDISAPQSMFEKNSVYIGQLSPFVTARRLRDHFEVHGTIEDISIVRRRDSTFAFVTFVDEFAAASAIARDNHSLFMNSTIHVKYKMSSGKKPTRMILSSRLPVALAPPPIFQRSRYSGTIRDWAASEKPRGPVDQFPIPRKLENLNFISPSKPTAGARFYIIPNSGWIPSAK